MKKIKVIDTDKIIKYHEQGFSLLQISKKLNCSISTLQLRLKQKNIILKVIDKDILIELYKNKNKISDIAK